MIRVIAFLSRKKGFQRLMSWVMTNMSIIIPTKKLRETDTLIAFFHPKPSHTFHILILPKVQYSSLMDISEKDTKFITDLFKTVKSLIMEYKLDKSGYRFITNGGKYQDINYLHFHLIADELGEA
jgi:histidine triad (HIT) family protein